MGVLVLAAVGVEGCVEDSLILGREEGSAGAGEAGALGVPTVLPPTLSLSLTIAARGRLRW